MNRIETEIEISLGLSECYSALLEFQRFPEFLQNVRQVRHLGDNQWRWILDTPMGQELEVDTMVHYSLRACSIDWTSTSPAIEGQLRLEKAQNLETFDDSGSQWGTRLICRVAYDFPGEGILEPLVHTTQAIRAMINEDLENFKEWVEDNSMKQSISGLAKSKLDKESQNATDDENQVVNVHYGIDETVPQIGTSTDIDGTADDVNELMELQEEEVPYAGLNNGAIYTEDDIDQRDDGMLNGEQEANDVFAASMDVDSEDLDNFTEDMDEEYDAVSNSQFRSGSQEGFSGSTERGNDRGLASNEQTSPSESGQTVR